MLERLEEILRKMKITPRTGYGEVRITIKFTNFKITHIKDVEKESSINVDRFK